jgi:hypothetical protein
MSLGGLLAAMDKRYFRLARKARQDAEKKKAEATS